MPSYPYQNMSYLKRLKAERRERRKNLSGEESELWWKLKAKRFHGYAWRRVYTIGNDFLTFYCPEARLAVEIIKLRPTQEEIIEMAKKTRRLEKVGIKILRFKEGRIYKAWDAVSASIYAALKERCPDPLVFGGKRKEEEQEDSEESESE